MVVAMVAVAGGGDSGSGMCMCPLHLFFLVPLSWCFRANPVTPSLLSLHCGLDGAFGGVILTHCSGLLSVWL